MNDPSILSACICGPRYPLTKSFTHSLIHTSHVSDSLVFCAPLVELGFDFLVHKRLVILQVLLDVDLEFDDVVEDLLNLRV